MTDIHIQNPHDKFFKETFRNLTVTKEFVTHYLPEHIVDIINIETLEPQKDSFIDADLKEVFSDLLFKVNMNQQVGYLYLLFEHKSYQSPVVAVQLLQYMCNIWKTAVHQNKSTKLPAIIPLVIYHGANHWHTGESLSDLIEGYHLFSDEMKHHTPDFKYILFDLSTFSDADLFGPLELRFSFTALRDIFSDNPDTLKQMIYQAIDVIYTLDMKDTGLTYFETLIRYIFSASGAFSKHDIHDIVNILEQTYPKGSDVVMTIADILREEGLEQGLEQG
ncbi:MAG: Rpn family recombination-promoting nuclease/putative transposase, partial [Bacillota bacterium]